MTSITIAIPDDRLRQLNAIAARLQIAPEELVRMTIDELLTRPDDAFQRAATYALKKNSELYRRLA